MWLLAPAVPAATGGTTDNTAQDPSAEDSAATNQSDNTEAAIDGASAATLATLAPVTVSAFAPTAANAPAVSSVVAAAAAGAAAVAAATANTVSGLNSRPQLDADVSFTASTSDHTSAADTVSSTDLSALAALVRTLPDGAAPSGNAEHSILVPVSDQNWSHAVAAQVQLFAAANVQNATLRLSPEHLGPVEVHIDVQASQINVSFVAAHAETRNALEQALPTLRALLAHGGLTLGQAHVQGESRSASQAFAARAHGVFGAAPIDDSGAAASARAVGLIDEYA